MQFRLKTVQNTPSNVHTAPMRAARTSDMGGSVAYDSRDMLEGDLCREEGGDREQTIGGAWEVGAPWTGRRQGNMVVIGRKLGG